MPDGRRAVVNGNPAAIAGDQQRVVCQSHDDALPDHLGDRVLDFGAGELIDDVEHVAEREAANLARIAPGKPAGNRVHQGDDAVRVRNDHAVSDAVKRRLQQVPGARHFQMELMPLGIADADDGERRANQEREQRGTRQNKQPRSRRIAFARIESAGQPGRLDALDLVRNLANAVHDLLALSSHDNGPGSSLSRGPA